MKTNLSSQIKLDRIPKRYYAPEGEVEFAALAREEKAYTRIFETMNDGSDYIAGHVVRIIKLNLEQKGRCVLALGAGMSTHLVYSKLIELHRRGEVSFKDVVVFNISEFFPLQPDGPSTLQRLREVFLDHIDIQPQNVRSIDPAVTKEDMYEYCKDYERRIDECGGIDLTLCEIGPQGALAFNEPGSLATSMCRLVLLSGEVRHSIANAYKTESVPTTAITLGVGNILKSTRVITMAWGENSASIVKAAVDKIL